jgi:hypothetical protein
MSTAHRFGEGPSDSGSDVEMVADPGIDLQSVRPIGKTFLSRGHFAGRWTAEVSTNEAALQAYANLAASTRFAVGTLLVKRHASTKDAGPATIFAMVKRDAGFFPQGGDWEYVVLDAAGRLEERGKLAPCARCHAEANADWVFGLPIEAR